MHRSDIPGKLFIFTILMDSFHTVFVVQKCYYCLPGRFCCSVLSAIIDDDMMKSEREDVLEFSDYQRSENGDYVVMCS